MTKNAVACAGAVRYVSGMHFLFLILLSSYAFSDACIEGAQARKFPIFKLAPLDCTQGVPPVTCETLHERLSAFAMKFTAQSGGVTDYVTDVSKWISCAETKVSAGLADLEAQPQEPLERLKEVVREFVTELGAGGSEMDQVNQQIGCSQAHLIEELSVITEAVQKWSGRVCPKPAQIKHRTRGR